MACSNGDAQIFCFTYAMLNLYHFPFAFYLRAARAGERIDLHCADLTYMCTRRRLLDRQVIFSHAWNRFSIRRLYARASRSRGFYETRFLFRYLPSLVKFVCHCLRGAVSRHCRGSYSNTSMPTM